jgi:hypothetical protein
MRNLAVHLGMSEQYFAGQYCAPPAKTLSRQLRVQASMGGGNCFDNAHKQVHDHRPVADLSELFLYEKSRMCGRRRPS